MNSLEMRGEEAEADWLYIATNYMVAHASGTCITIDKNNTATQTDSSDQKRNEAKRQNDAQNK